MDVTHVQNSFDMRMKNEWQRGRGKKRVQDFYKDFFSITRPMTSYPNDLRAELAQDLQEIFTGIYIVYTYRYIDRFLCKTKAN